MVGESAGPLPWFPVKHETPDAFMEPEWIVHPNGALGMMAIHAIAETPKETAKAPKAAWGATVEEIFDGCTMVKAGSVELLIWSPLAFQLEYKALEMMMPTELPAVIGAAVAIERARPLQGLLSANNVPFALAEGDRVLVAPEQTGGLTDRVHPAELTPALFGISGDLNCNGMCWGLSPPPARQRPGVIPVSRLNARLNAASDS